VRYIEDGHASRLDYAGMARDRAALKDKRPYHAEDGTGRTAQGAGS
jgi:hypothetical protein